MKNRSSKPVELTRIYALAESPMRVAVGELCYRKRFIRRIRNQRAVGVTESQVAVDQSVLKWIRYLSTTLGEQNYWIGSMVCTASPSSRLGESSYLRIKCIARNTTAASGATCPAEAEG